MTTEKLKQQRKISSEGIKYTSIYFVTLSFYSLVPKMYAGTQNILLFLTLSVGRVVMQDTHLTQILKPGNSNKKYSVPKHVTLGVLKL